MKYPVVNLNAVAKINNGFAFKSKDYVNSGYRVIRITNVQRGEIVDSEPKFISNEMALKYKPYQLFFGDLLISLTGNVGRVGVFKREHEPALLNQRVASIIIKSNKILPKYLFQYLNSSKFEQEAIIKSKGIAQLNLSSKWLETYKIPLPPIDEQIRIATLLNKVESLMAKRKKSIEDLDALLKSTFLEMFGDPVKNEMGWGKKRIGEFAKIRIGPFGSLLHAEDYVENGIPLINPKNIIEGKIVPNNSFSLSKKKYWELNDYHLKKNDIIVARRGEIGRCALVEKDTPLFCGTGSMFIRIAKDWSWSLSSTLLRKRCFPASTGISAIRVSTINDV